MTRLAAFRQRVERERRWADAMGAEGREVFEQTDLPLLLAVAEAAIDALGYIQAREGAHMWMTPVARLADALDPLLAEVSE